MRKTTTPLKQAIKQFGSQQALGDAIGWSQDAISTWLNNPSRKIPAEAAVEIEAVTDGAITRQQLRPDLFGAT